MFDPPKEFQVGEPSVAESRLYSAGLSAKGPKGTALVPGKPALFPAGPARNTRESVVVIFAEGNRIVKYCVVVLNYLFGVSKNSQLPFLGSFLVKMAPS